MALRQIIYTDNPLLRQKSRRVRQVTPEIEKLVQDMFETMREANGVGLAAVQVAVPLRVIVVELPSDSDAPNPETSFALINPELARVSEEMEKGVEGCLSVPGWAGHVERHAAVTVKGMDLRGKKVRMRAEGYLARVLQHEIDHLNGVLFIDRTDEVWPVEEGEEEAVEARYAAKGGTPAPPFA